MTGYDFDPEALREYESAVIYYEQRREGLGQRFMQAVENAMETAMATPSAGAPWPDLPLDLGIRRWRIPGFPSVLIAYTPIDEADILRVVAVVHTRRHPGYWFHRI